MKCAEDRQGTELSAHREVLICPAVGSRVSVGKLRHGGDPTTKESREAYQATTLLQLFEKLVRSHPRPLTRQAAPQLP